MITIRYKIRGLLAIIRFGIVLSCSLSFLLASCSQNCRHLFSWIQTPHCNLNNDKLNKGKAIPLQAWTGPEGSRRLRIQDFKTIGT